MKRLRNQIPRILIRFVAFVACIGTLTQIASASPLNATTFTGAPEIMTQVQNAFISCNYQCAVEIPAGNYTATVGLLIPLVNLNNPDLIVDAGAVINFQPTGPSFWVDTYEVQSSPSAANLVIEGAGTINGNGNAAGGIRLLPTNNIEIKGIRIASFTNGDAIQIDGTEHVNIHNVQMTAGATGVHIYGTNCSQSPPYSCAPGSPVTCGSGTCGYAGNMIHVDQCDFSFFTAGAFYEDGMGGSYEHLSDTFTNNEVNGGSIGVITTGSRSLVVQGNYFENQSVYFLLLRGSSSLHITGAYVTGNYFTSTLAFTVEAEFAYDSIFQGNSENKGAGAGSVCFLNFISSLHLLYQENHVEGTNGACNNGAGGALFGGTSPNIAILNSGSPASSVWVASNHMPGTEQGLVVAMTPVQKQLEAKDATMQVSAPRLSHLIHRFWLKSA